MTGGKAAGLALGVGTALAGGVIAWRGIKEDVDSSVAAALGVGGHGKTASYATGLSLMALGGGIALLAQYRGDR